MSNEMSSNEMSEGMVRFLPPLVLASGSPRRREILKQLGFHFTVVVPDVDEELIKGTLPKAGVAKIAARKALAARKRIQEGIDTHEGGILSRFEPMILACDTLVYFEGEMLGKPRSSGEATEMLLRLSGKEHEVWSGVALLNGRELLTRSAVTKVVMREYDVDEASLQIESGEPFDKAGGYGIQSFGARLVKEVHGCYYNVVGLPIFETLELFTEMFGSDYFFQDTNGEFYV